MTTARHAIAGSGIAVVLALSSAAASAGTTPYAVSDVGAAPASRFSVSDIGATPTANTNTNNTDAAPTANAGINDTDTAPTANAGDTAPAPDITGSKTHAAPTPGYKVTDSTPALSTGFRISDIGPAVGTDRTSNASHTLEPDDPDAQHASSSALSAARPGTSTTPATETATETWLVQPGDHLWDIAAQTVTVRAGGAGSDPTDAHTAVLRYWLKLMAANAEVLGDSPGVIYPGQVIRLPG